MWSESVHMSEFADDIEAFAREMTHTDEFEERFDELIQEGFDKMLGPSEHLDFVVDTLFEELVADNDDIQTEVPGVGELFEATFKKETAIRFAQAVGEREEFHDHIENLAMEMDEEDSES